MKLIQNTIGFYSHIAWINRLDVWIFTLFCILVAYIFMWNSTATMTVSFMAAILPITLAGYIHLQCWNGLYFGLLGICCFLADRFLKIPLHSLWHFGIGVSLWCSCYSIIINKVIL